MFWENHLYWSTVLEYVLGDFTRTVPKFYLCSVRKTGTVQKFFGYVPGDFTRTDPKFLFMF